MKPKRLATFLNFRARLFTRLLTTALIVVALAAAVPAQQKERPPK